MIVGGGRTHRLLIGVALTLSAAVLSGCAPPHDRTHARDKSGPRVEITSRDGPGPVALRPADGGYVGRFQIVSRGDAPLHVLRVALRGESDDPVSPPHVVVSWGGRVGEVVELPPGEAKEVTIAWMPDRHAKLADAWGQVVVTTDDEAEGEIAKGFVGHIAGTSVASPRMHAAALMLPAFLGLVALLLLRGVKHEHRRQSVVRAVAAVSVAGALVLALAFPHGLMRGDGNEGLAFIDRLTLLPSWGVELFLGVDAVAVFLSLAVATSLLVEAFRAGAGPTARSSPQVLLLGALLGALLAEDLVSVSFVVIASTAALVALFGASEKPAPASPTEPSVSLLPFVMLVVTLAWAGAAAALHAKGGRAFLSGGTTTFGTWALPELRRASDVHWGPSFFSYNDLAHGALLVVLLLTIPVPPFHRWLLDALDRRQAGGGALLVATTVLGPALGLRVLAFALPDAFVRVSLPLSVLALLGGLYAALGSMAARPLRRSLVLLLVASANVEWVAVAAAGLSGAGALLACAGVRICAGTLALSVCDPRPMSRPHAALFALSVLAVGGLPPSLAGLALWRSVGLVGHSSTPLALLGAGALLATAVAALTLAARQIRAAHALPTSEPRRALGPAVVLVCLLAALSAPVWGGELSLQVRDWLRTSV